MFYKHLHDPSCDLFMHGEEAPQSKEAQLQAALDAERADNAMAREAYWATIADLRSELATLQAQLADEQQRADRAVKDRSEVLDVKTKEGLSCSEWLMRTATAERQVNELKAQLWQVEEALDEALGALGYPVPADTPSPGRYKCGLCEAATLAAQDAKDAGKEVGNGNS